MFKQNNINKRRNKQIKKDLILFEIILKEVDIDEDKNPIIEKNVKINFHAIDRGALKGVSPNEYLTLMLISSYIDKDGKCYPTQARLANQLGMSRQTVSQYIHDLKKIIIYDYGKNFKSRRGKFEEKFKSEEEITLGLKVVTTLCRENYVDVSDVLGNFKMVN